MVLLIQRVTCALVVCEGCVRAELRSQATGRVGVLGCSCDS